MYIVEKIDKKDEFSLSLQIDKKAECLIFKYSLLSYIRIEEIEIYDPDKIFKLPLDIK